MSELATSRTGGVAPANDAHAADAALMRAVAAGDRAAFARVYETHQPRVFRLAYGVLLDRDEAREAVQKAFLKLHEAAGRWEPNAALGTWLYRVVLNHCLSSRRRLLRFGRGAPPAGARPSPELAAALGEAVGMSSGASARCRRDSGPCSRCASTPSSSRARSRSSWG